MNVFSQYHDYLKDCGFSATEAERIIRVKSDRASKHKPGPIQMKKLDDGNAELLLYDVIGFDFWTGGGTTPKGLVDELEAMKPFNNITLRINSPGGDVFDGMTIFNILRRQECKVSVEVEGLAASAASFIAQVADPGELRISEAGMFMVHRAWGGCVGNTNDMLEFAGLLDKLDGQIAGIYASRSKRKVDTWLKLMDEETWLTGSEAVDAKLADATVTTQRAAAFDLRAFNYRNAPEPTEDEEETADIPDTEVEDKAAAVATRLRILELEAG
jgi:ATP-dependent Clp protease protease subunit